MSALALVSGVGDGTSIIIMCLPDASGELLLIFLREPWGGAWQPKHCDGTNIIIMCLPDASGELLLIFLREWWGETWQPKQEG